MRGTLRTWLAPFFGLACFVAGAALRDRLPLFGLIAVLLVGAGTIYYAWPRLRQR